MRKLLLALALLVPAMCQAQSTSVSGNVSDAGSQSWFGGTYAFTFVPSPSNPTAPPYWNGSPFTPTVISGALDGSANYSASVPSNTSIVPSGSQWELTVCSAATYACYTQKYTVTGATQTVSPVPPAIQINMATPATRVTAYSDSEVINGNLGQQYFNLTDNSMHLCTSFPCGWTIGGTSRLNPGPITFVSAATAPRTVTFPDNTGTVAELNLAQTWTAANNFSGNNTANSINHTRYVDGVVYSLNMSGLAQAVQDCLSDTLCSKVDASQINGNVSGISSTLALDSPTKALMVILGSFNVILTGNPGITVQSGSHIIGTSPASTIFTCNTSAAPCLTWTGSGGSAESFQLKQQQSNADVLLLSDSGFANVAYNSFRNLTLIGQPSASAGDCVHITTSSTTGITALNDFYNLNVVDCLNNVEFSASAAGGVTDNHFYGGQFRSTVAGTGVGFLFSGSTNTVAGNIVYATNIASHATGVNFVGASTFENGIYGSILESNTLDVNLGTGSSDDMVIGGGLNTVTNNGTRSTYFSTSGGLNSQLGYPMQAFSISGGAASLPAGIGTNLYLAGGFTSPNLGRLYIGSNTGWQFNISTRSSGADTDLFTFKDNGQLTMQNGGELVSPVIAGTPTGTGIGTTVYKSGSGSGNYTGPDTSLKAVDTTNLCYSVTVPTGWKLSVTASGVLASLSAAVAIDIALSDVGATCTTGGVTALTATQRSFTPPAFGTYDVGWTTGYVLTGNGSAHSIALMVKTANGSDDWGIQNSAAALAPSMVFTLMPSN